LSEIRCGSGVFAPPHKQTGADEQERECSCPDQTRSAQSATLTGVGARKRCHIRSGDQGRCRGRGRWRRRRRAGCRGQRQCEARLTSHRVAVVADHPKGHPVGPRGHARDECLSHLGTHHGGLATRHADACRRSHHDGGKRGIHGLAELQDNVLGRSGQLRIPVRGDPDQLGMGRSRCRCDHRGDHGEAEGR